MERPCKCNECNLCAVYAAAHGLPVKKPERQPTLAELKAFNDEATGKQKQSKRKKPADVPDLFSDRGSDA